MKKITTYKFFLIILIIFFPLFAIADIPIWQIVPNESSITFTGVQNNAPATGKFNKFTGLIQFDSQQLLKSKVRIVIDMSSVSTGYSDLTTTLMTNDWFNVRAFPQAIFEASQFKKINSNKYHATGTLTIRDKTIPVTLLFEAKELSSIKYLVQGSTILKRTLFGIGQGEWRETDTVKDNVQVNFIITAIKK